MGFGGKVLLVGLTSVFAALTTYLYQRKKKDIVPWKWQEIGKVKKINLFPLKSGHRLELQKAECTEFGLRQTEDDEKLYQMRDRSLVVYAERDQEFRTARTYPKMVLIDVSVHDENYLTIDAPTMRTLYVKIPDAVGNKEMVVRLHKGEEIYAIDCGDEAASWFSRYILETDSGLRLGYHDASCRNDISKVHKNFFDYYIHLPKNSSDLYSDLTGVHLVNQSSIQDLNKRIGSSRVTADNFRPNLVVDGPNIVPYAEDEWVWIKIGNVVLRNEKECMRSILTTVDPENATRSTDREPLKTLEKYRMSNGPSSFPTMGINCKVQRTGIIKIGDPVFIGRDD